MRKNSLQPEVRSNSQFLIVILASRLVNENCESFVRICESRSIPRLSRGPISHSFCTQPFILAAKSWLYKTEARTVGRASAANLILRCCFQIEIEHIWGRFDVAFQVSLRLYLRL